MILADDVPYPRQYLSPDALNTSNELYAGYIVMRPGADPIFVWWDALKNSNPLNRTEAELQQWCSRLELGMRTVMRTYPAPELIHPKYLFEDG